MNHGRCFGILLPIQGLYHHFDTIEDIAGADEIQRKRPKPQHGRVLGKYSPQRARVATTKRTVTKPINTILLCGQYYAFLPYRVESAAPQILTPQALRRHCSSPGGTAKHDIASANLIARRSPAVPSLVSATSLTRKPNCRLLSDILKLPFDRRNRDDGTERPQPSYLEPTQIEL